MTTDNAPERAGEDSNATAPVRLSRQPLVSVGPLGTSEILRLPSLDDESERAVAQANTRRRDQASATVDERIGRSPEAELRHRRELTDSMTPLMWDLPERWTGVTSIYEQIDNIMRHDDTRPGRLTIGLESAQPGVTEELSFDTTYGLHRPNMNHISRTLTGGASMVLRAVGRHMDDVNELVAALETLLGAAMEADAILFGPDSTHFDPADRGGAVLVIPLDVDLSATIEPAALTHEGEPSLETMATIEETATVSPGSAVAGYTDHSLRLRADTAGIALRIVLPSPTRTQLWSHAVTLARHHPLLRADLPTDLDAPVHSYAGSLYDRPGAFHAEASMSFGATPTMHALATLRAQVPTRAASGLFDNLRSQPDCLPTLRAGIPGGITLTGAVDHLAASGMALHIAPQLAELLIPHLDGAPFDPTPIVNAFAGESVPTPPESHHPNPAIEALEILLHAELLEVVA